MSSDGDILETHWINSDVLWLLWFQHFFNRSSCMFWSNVAIVRTTELSKLFVSLFHIYMINTEDRNKFNFLQENEFKATKVRIKFVCWLAGRRQVAEWLYHVAHMLNVYGNHFLWWGMSLGSKCRRLKLNVYLQIHTAMFLSLLKSKHILRCDSTLLKVWLYTHTRTTWQGSVLCMNMLKKGLFTECAFFFFLVNSEMNASLHNLWTWFWVLFTLRHLTTPFYSTGGF